MQKYGKLYFSYMLPVSVDRRHKLIRRAKVSVPARPIPDIRASLKPPSGPGRARPGCDPDEGF